MSRESKKVQQLQERIESLENHLQELNAIGMLLSTEKDLGRLLEIILSKARSITQADSGSLYLVERVEVPESEITNGSDSSTIDTELMNESGDDYIERLRFKLAQNFTVNVTLSEFTIPINRSSIVGYVALNRKTLVIKDVYEMGDSTEFSHNRGFDVHNNYRTKSMLVVPMQDQHGELYGILQLINKKSKADIRLDNAKAIKRDILSFTDTDRELVESLASQASVAIANAKLYQGIQNLFEGFVQASVMAIESRDPTTSGHSSRVATMTCKLAETLDKQSVGKYKNYFFSPQDMRELRYAALLHDFGKIGVREEVLIKAKKLYPYELEVVTSRFAYIRRSIELGYSKKKLDYTLDKTREQAAEHLASLDSELAEKLSELDKYYEFILKANEPTILEEGAFEYLRDIAAREFTTVGGDIKAYLDDYEVQALSVRKGSLSPEERLQIESHVTHSYLFLRQIPWTRDLRRVPAIAYAHHEKLNGSGYPRKITENQIPFQARIMTITDIFDALTAQDRPYKKAVPVQKALDILKMEVDDGQLDEDLYSIFLDAKIFESVIKKG